MGRIEQTIRDVGRRRVLSNAAIYIVAAWVVIQVADVAIDAGVIRWPLRNFFVAALLGFPVALIVSWYYDITREGLVRTPPVDADCPFDKSLRKKDFLLLASLAAIWVVANIAVHTPTPVEKSVAILPFENIGHDPGNAMFAFGIRADLQNQLQNIRDLKIIARESSDRIDGGMSFPEISLKLGAAYIMKGTVERVLDRVRISVSLINAENEVQTWTGSYDRELTASNWFDIRNEISGVITDSLQAELSPAEKDKLASVPTEIFAAHQAYLLGEKRMEIRSTAALTESVAYFKEAVELDPDYALAWVGLADSLYLRMTYSGLSEDEEIPKVETALENALELDDRLGEAYVTLTSILLHASDSAEAEVAIRRAIELNPNYSHAYRWYGIVLDDVDRYDEALTQKRKALELNPLSPIVNMNVAISLKRLGRFEEALEQVHKVIEIDPAFPNAYETVGSIYWEQLGQLDQAVAWYRKAVARDPGQASSPRTLGFIYLDLGDTAQAEYWLSRSAIVQPEFWLSDMIMEPLHVRLGEKTKALEYARRNLAFEPRGPYTLADLRNYDLLSGRYADARARYAIGYPELLQDDEPTIHRGNFQVAIDLALVLAKTGEQERADLLLGRSLTFIPTMPRLGGMGNGYGIADVLIYAQQGKTDAALQALRQAIDQRWRTGWWFYIEHDPSLDPIREEPGYQAMVDEIKAEMAAQLQHVEAMEANGELEPIPEAN